MTRVEGGAASQQVMTEDRRLQGPHGDLPIRLYIPATRRDRQLGLVWCHGGAFVYGDLEQPESDWVARSLAAAGIAVIAVDYRLSPVPQWALDVGADTGNGTSHYPVAREEVEHVLEWANAELSDMSVGGWALGGASAGGNLAAAATLSIRDRDGVLPQRLMLAYPLLHAALPAFADELQARLDAAPPTPGIALSPQVVDLLTLNYVGGDAQLLEDPKAFPGGHDLTGFPPTFLLHSDVDTIRASGDAFAAELAAAGVAVASLHEPGTAHGHLSDPADLAAERSVRRMSAWLTASWVDPAAQDAQVLDEKGSR